MGPGKHLHGLSLLPASSEVELKGENFDYFHEQIITQELIRGKARGFGEPPSGGSEQKQEGIPKADTPLGTRCFSRRVPGRDGDRVASNSQLRQRQA